MKRLPLSFITVLSVSLTLGMACDVEKEDEPLNTQAIEDDGDSDDEDDEDDEDVESSGSDSASTSAGGDDGGDDGGDSASTSAGGDGGNDGGDDSAGTGEGGGTDEVNAFAIRHGDLPEVDAGESGSDTGDDGDDIAADAVHVFVSGSGIATCEAPFEGEPCGGNWSVSFTLQPNMLEPGSYNLFEEANGGFTYADEPYEEGDCAWGGGTLDGVLVIEAVDEEGIVGHIEGSDAFDFDADIDFYAPHCG